MNKVMLLVIPQVSSDIKKAAEFVKVFDGRVKHNHLGDVEYGGLLLLHSDSQDDDRIISVRERISADNDVEFYSNVNKFVGYLRGYSMIRIPSAARNSMFPLYKMFSRSEAPIAEAANRYAVITLDFRASGGFLRGNDADLLVKDIARHFKNQTSLCFVYCKDNKAAYKDFTPDGNCLETYKIVAGSSFISAKLANARYLKKISSKIADQVIHNILRRDT